MRCQFFRKLRAWLWLITHCLILTPTLKVNALTDESHEDAAVVHAAARTCEAKGFGASGMAFTTCITDALKSGGMQLSLQKTHTEIIRNFSCASDDPGSRALRTLQLSVETGYSTCVDASSDGFDFAYVPAALPQGNDLIPPETVNDVSTAISRCAALDRCAGVTFQAESREGGPVKVWFKSTFSGAYPLQGWHTYRRKRQDELTCAAAPAMNKLLEYSVDILRESPLVAVVRGFASAECDDLVRAGGNWESMRPAHTNQGGPNNYRRSYSSNIYPNLRNTSNAITQLVGRMFAIVRNLTNYVLYPPGQEPMTAVLYKDPGDEYRPHCDGTCDGRKHLPGERIATSIIYCHVPELGGSTTFTENVLKITPARGDMLVFSYRPTADYMAGKEVHHSGCPIRAGKKWIATQWYREHVDENWDWQKMLQMLKVARSRSPR